MLGLLVERCRLVRILAIGVTAAATLLAPRPAHADVLGDLGMLVNPVSRGTIERTKRLLKLDEEQSAIATDLYSGYRAASKAMFDEAEAKRRQLYEKAREKDDWSGVNKAAREIMRASAAEMERLNQNLMEDIRSLLNADQSRGFDAAARLQRRESSRYVSLLAGERADVLDILEGMKVDPTATPELGSLLGEHEVALDRLLQARHSLLQSAYDTYFKADDDYNMWRDAWPKLLDHCRRIRDLNRQAARRITDILTSEQRAKFEDEFSRRSFPEIYKEPIVAKRLKAARGLEDLDASQKEELDLVEQSYQRDLEPANAAWRRWMERAQDAILLDAAKGRGDQNANQSLREAVEARRALDKKYLDKVDGALRAEQVSRLSATSRDIPKYRSSASPDWDRESVRKWLKDEE